VEERATPPPQPRRDRTRYIVAVLMILVGLVWAAQGLGVPIGRGFMVGDLFWTWAGLALAIAGLVVAVWPRFRGS